MKPYKVVNRIEVFGLIRILDENISYTSSIEGVICGTSDNRLINLQNVQVDIHPEGLPMLGGFGLSEGNDVILQYWDEAGQESREFWVNYSDLLHRSGEELINRLKEIE